MTESPRIAVIGLGYVGLPLAVALADHFTVIGFDIDRGRVDALRRGEDATREIAPERLAASPLTVSGQAEDIAGSDVYLITVPTPVDSAKRPDLGAVLAACGTVGKAIAARPTISDDVPVVVLESTVYPGVTEEACGPAIARAAGREHGTGFRLGYSPERINPGDTVHTVDRITKVVAGETAEVSDLLARIYGAINGGNIFIAADIRTAEAAKVIENAQRDINIAFVNEVATIFRKLGLSVYDVLEAAGTKWNFLPFTPGLVGGHCIGVDPYYLAFAAEKLGHHPQVILSGRRINDQMGQSIGHEIDRALRRRMADGRNGRVLVLGLTFKEDVPDLRNTRVVDVVQALRETGHRVAVHDPLADAGEAKAEYDLDLLPDLDGAAGYDALVAAVAHADYRMLDDAALSRLVRAGGLIADIKGVWRDRDLPTGRDRWTL